VRVLRESLPDIDPQPSRACRLSTKPSLLHAPLPKLRPVRHKWQTQ
jgi:hypothetical protein